MKEQKNHSEIFKIDGVGVNLEKFKPCENASEKSELRKKFKYDDSDFIILYIAEFIPRKDHEFFIKNIPALKSEIPNLKVIMPGKGAELKTMKILSVNLEVDDTIWFPGYRRDINLLCRTADLYAATSRQEGLPVSVIEAMASGLPVVASNIRGQSDAVQSGVNGELYTLGDSNDFVEKIVSLYKNPALRLEMGKRNVEEAKKYSVEIAVNKMAQIYDEVIDSEHNGLNAEIE